MRRPSLAPTNDTTRLPVRLCGRKPFCQVLHSDLASPDSLQVVGVAEIKVLDFIRDFQELDESFLFHRDRSPLQGPFVRMCATSSHCRVRRFAAERRS
jgi:hypothetical protein